mgnify:CR=1 FL=1
MTSDVKALRENQEKAKILTKLNPNIKIIFITAYRDYAAEAFEIKAFDYLLKPYSEKRITEVLNNLTMIKDNIILTKKWKKLIR